jgi:hypothetical protein
MTEQKTKPTSQDVQAFLDSLDNEQKKQDAQTLLQLMQEVTGETPTMWGSSMIGFGSYHYKYATGREGDAFVAGFSPRKDNLTLYIMGGFDQYAPLLEKLGKHKIGKACLYVKKLSDVDLDTLKEMVRRSAEHIKTTYPD